jgi:hypothetical protein
MSREHCVINGGLSVEVNLLFALFCIQKLAQQSTSFYIALIRTSKRDKGCSVHIRNTEFRYASLSGKELYLWKLSHVDGVYLF